jgi:hypothetical protein
MKAQRFETHDTHYPAELKVKAIRVGDYINGWGQVLTIGRHGDDYVFCTQLASGALRASSWPSSSVLSVIVAAPSQNNISITMLDNEAERLIEAIEGLTTDEPIVGEFVNAMEAEL